MATTMKELIAKMEGTIRHQEAELASLVELAKSQLASPKGSPAYMSWNRTRNLAALSRSKLEIQKGLLEQWKRNEYTREEAE